MIYIRLLTSTTTERVASVKEDCNSNQAYTIAFDETSELDKLSELIALLYRYINLKAPQEKFIELVSLRG